MNKNIEIAGRTAPFQESVIREMTRLGDVTDSVNLSQGLPDFDPPDSVLKSATEAIRSGKNQYTFPFGTADFRSAISRRYAQYNDIDANPDTEITVTCGVSEAMMSTLLALTEPGDEVIIFEPWYENYVPDCLMAGVKPIFVTLHEPNYKFDLEKLRSSINKKTRIIIINTPHNPTGRVFSYEELNEIAKLCREFGIIAVTDEIYEYIYYGKHRHISIGSLEGMSDRTVTISGLSKTYAVTGWRVGWAIADEALSSEIRKVHDYLTVCAPSPFQFAGITALNLDEEYYQNMRALYSKRRNILLETLKESNFNVLDPEGSYYIMADFSEIDWDLGKYDQHGWSKDRVFAEFMAREVGVAVVPGSSFYHGDNSGTSTVRFNFAKQEDTLRKALRRIVKNL